MNEVIVFVGPSLPLAEARRHLHASYFGPAALGDVARAVRRSPFAIGLIDGRFESVPAVWHKEILWALCSGIHVFGAASMGALRAAELSAFGMRGVGRIFSEVESGTIEDDDEVAVAHGSSESGYVASSEPLVNVRYTLESARLHQVITRDESTWLVSLARQMFYPDRTYPSLFRAAKAAGLEAERLQALERFVEEHRVDQKRADAIELLAAIKSTLSRAEPPPPRPYTLAHTDAWDALKRWVDAQPDLAGAEV